MFRNEYELTVDLKKRMIAVTPTFVQYDNAKLIFKIFDNGKPYDLTEFTKAEVSHKRADGKTVVGTATIELSSNGQNQIVYQYLGNEMSKAGFNDTSLSIFSIDKKVSIQPFRVHIITDLRDGLVESSKEEAGVLQELIAQVGALVDSASTAVINAEKAVIDAEQAVINAGLAQSTAQTAADEANLARDEALLAAQSATDAITATTVAIANTEIATNDADIATGKANFAANNADAKATLAETATSKVDARIILVDQAIVDSQTATAGVTTAINETNVAKDEAILATDKANTAATNANDQASLAETATINADSSALNADNKATLAEQKANLADTATTNANLATDALNLALPNIEGWINKGEYNSTTAYVKHNMVTLNGSTYQAKNPTTGNPPTDTLYWSLMAQRGVDGTGSVVSVNNIPPDINGNVDIGAISSTWVDITGKPSEFTPSAHSHVISDVTGLQTALNNAGTKDIATPLINGLMSKEDKGKLDGVENEANKYVHPASHPASMIVEDSSRRFVSDIKLTELNAKETTTGAQAKATLAENNAKSYTDVKAVGLVDKVAGKGLSTEDFTSTEKTKLAGIASNANNYVHPANHPASIIIQDTSNRLVTDAQITSWNGKSGFDGNYSNLTNIPTTFAPAAHTHTVADVTGLQTELDKIGVLTDSVDAHKTVMASTTILGHVKVDGTSITIDENGVISGYVRPKDDVSGSPGSPYLLDGTIQAGYFGLVPASDLFTATALSAAVGISVGIVQHDATPWLKFAWKGKILFRPQKAIRHTISWDNINSAGCVMGTKTISKDGKAYRVRLMQGALTNPSAGTAPDLGAKGSEWNRLMLPIHEQATTGAWTYPSFAEAAVVGWGIGFTDADLLTQNSYGSGSFVWCQETRSDNTSNRVTRGFNGVTNSSASASSVANVNYGWAPVLELI